MLIVYVDDMKLSGPLANMPAAWEALGKNIRLDEPRGNEEGVHTFLGCTHRQKTRYFTPYGDLCGKKQESYSL